MNTATRQLNPTSTAEIFRLCNKDGMIVDISNYGGTIVRILTPDRDGKMADVVLGFDTIEDYFTDSPYFGSIVGRYGNRIANGQFTLDGATYDLARNDVENICPGNLHGGDQGFDKKIWATQRINKDGCQGLCLKYLSPDGEEGFPGNLDVTVHYWLSNDNTLRIEYTATTDQATPVNLTNHSYFNLNGEGNPSILDHEMTIFASNFTPVAEDMIPNGDIAPVEGTPFDFSKKTPIGERIDADHAQLKYAEGYDHNYIIEGEPGTLRRAAVVTAPKTGRVLEVWTEEPGVQFYTGNNLRGDLTGKSGRLYPPKSGFCLETQHYPDSPNQPNFPSTILRPGETYATATEFRFRNDG